MGESDEECPREAQKDSSDPQERAYMIDDNGGGGGGGGGVDFSLTQ